MGTFFDLLKLFFLNSKIKITRNMQYRFDFISGLFISLLVSSVGVVVLYLIFRNTSGYPGWSLKQIFLFQGVLLLWNGLKDILFGEVRINVDTMIRKGEFDRLLLKPLPPIGLILVGGPTYTSITVVAAGIIMIISSASSLGLVIGTKEILLFLLFMTAGLFLYMTFLVLYSMITILIVYTERISEVVDKILKFSEYPVEIFTRGTRFAFAFIVPLSLFIYLPAQAFLDRLDIKAFISVPVGFILFFLALRAWNLCLKRYSSTGG